MTNASGLVTGGDKEPHVAEEALNKYDGVKLGTVATNGQYVKKGTAGARGVGFVDEAFNAGQGCDVQINGSCYARAADANISEGDSLKLAADAEVTTADTDGDKVVAIALAPSVAENDAIPVRVVNYVLSVPA